MFGVHLRFRGLRIIFRHVIRTPQFVLNIRTLSSSTKIPFLEFYESITGSQLTESEFSKMKKRHRRLDELTASRLANVQSVLEQLGVCAAAACTHPGVLTVHPHSARSYGQVLRECGFHRLQPSYITRYHTLVRSRTIAQLKKEGLIMCEMSLEDKLIQCFRSWPSTHKITDRKPEQKSSILQVRMKIVSQYLNWRLDISSEEFEKICHNYYAVKHRPMADLEEAIDLAQNDIKFTADSIKRHGFIISADPANTKLILENVKELAGVEIRQVLRMMPAVIKNNHTSLIRIRDILEEYRIDEDTQRRCFMVYCMNPDTVQERLAELSQMKEFQVLSTNPRALQMVVHHKKMLQRLLRLRAANKQCYSLHNLLSSASTFNEYVSNFGDRTCIRDLAAVICSALRVEVRAPPAALAPPRATRSGESVACVASPTVTPRAAHAAAQLRRHPYWRHVPPDVVHANVRALQRTFGDHVIYEHCQLLLYPMSEIEPYLTPLLDARRSASAPADSPLAPLRHAELSDAQLLSLVLYAIERPHHFTGDGIWSKGEAHSLAKVKADG